MAETQKRQPAQGNREMLSPAKLSVSPQILFPFILFLKCKISLQTSHTMGFLFHVFRLVIGIKTKSLVLSVRD